MDAEKEIKYPALMSRKIYCFHFHVWTETEMIEFFLNQKRRHDFEIELFSHNINEMIFVLRKT